MNALESQEVGQELRLDANVAGGLDDHAIDDSESLWVAQQEGGDLDLVLGAVAAAAVKIPDDQW